MMRLSTRSPYVILHLHKGRMDYRVKPGNDSLNMTYAASFFFSGAKR